MGYQTSGELVSLHQILLLTHLTNGFVNRSEYVTIASIMICMTIWDFVIGVLFGIVMSCKFLYTILSSNIHKIASQASSS